MKRYLSRGTIDSDPNAVWNACVDLLAMSAYDELDGVQRAPYLAFWYESEVQNGGHLQFFENQPEELIDPTMQALAVIGAVPFVPILREAVERRRSRPRPKLENVEDFIAAARLGEFDDLDRAYYNQEPVMIRFLESYLDANFGDFIEIEG